MYLFFDTETCGLPKNWKAPITDLNNWPRLVQLAYLYFDEKGEKLSEGNYIVKPEGFSIPAETSKVHGISNIRAIEEGVALEAVLLEFQSMVSKSKFLVAHNMSFDEKIVGAEFLRKEIKCDLQKKKRICTMDRGKDYCAIDGPYGYKWPKLSELHSKLFGKGFEEAHNASVDILATAKCFWELRRLGKI